MVMGDVVRVSVCSVCGTDYGVPFAAELCATHGVEDPPPYIAVGKPVYVFGGIGVVGPAVVEELVLSNPLYIGKDAFLHTYRVVTDRPLNAGLRRCRQDNSYPVSACIPTQGLSFLRGLTEEDLPEQVQLFLAALATYGVCYTKKQLRALVDARWISNPVQAQFFRHLLAAKV